MLIFAGAEAAGASGIAASLSGAAAARSGDPALPAATWPLRLTDFMTPEMLDDVRRGTLKVDCAPALQAAFDTVSGVHRSSFETGGKLHVPAGRYLLATPVNFSWRNDQRVFDDGDMRRLTIEGDGQGNTVFFYRGDPGRPAVEVRGFKSSPGHGDGVALRLTISGLQIVRDLATRHRGSGLSLEGAALIRLLDMEVSAFDVNIDMVDVLRVYMESVHINGGRIGLQARGNNFSNPNVYKLVHCSLSGNRVAGAKIRNGCNISFDTCAIEGNGHDRQRAAASLWFDGGPSQGGSAGSIVNCYFENNFAAADVLLDWNDEAGGTMKVTACTFQRTSAARAALHHLLLKSESAPLRAHVDSCAFKGFGDYVPNAQRSAVASKGRAVQVHYTANLFQYEEEAPANA